MRGWQWPWLRAEKEDRQSIYFFPHVPDLDSFSTGQDNIERFVVSGSIVVFQADEILDLNLDPVLVLR